MNLFYRDVEQLAWLVRVGAVSAAEARELYGLPPGVIEVRPQPLMVVMHGE